MAKQYHPDVNKTSEAKRIFSEINEAHQTLSDPDKRSIYDSTGMTANQQENEEHTHSGFSPFGFGFGSSKPTDFKSYDQILKEFNEFFSLDSKKLKAKDVHVSLDVEFSEAVTGIRRTVEYQKDEICVTCNGSGHNLSSFVFIECSECNGKGNLSADTPCETCEGTGKLRQPCVVCDGQGAHLKNCRVQAEVPQGVSDGVTLRMKGYGNRAVKGGIDGDLLIKIKVKPHTEFKQDGADIYSEQRISPTQAILGATFQIKTLQGVQQVSIEPGTACGT